MVTAEPGKREYGTNGTGWNRRKWWGGVSLLFVPFVPFHSVISVLSLPRLSSHEKKPRESESNNLTAPRNIVYLVRGIRGRQALISNHK